MEPPGALSALPRRSPRLCGEVDHAIRIITFRALPTSTSRVRIFRSPFLLPLRRKSDNEARLFTPILFKAFK